MENLILTHPNGASLMARRLSSISPCKPLWRSGWIRTFIPPLRPKVPCLRDVEIYEITRRLPNCGPLRRADLLIVEAVQGFYHNSGVAAVGSATEKQLCLMLKYSQSLLFHQIRALSWV